MPLRKESREVLEEYLRSRSDQGEELNSLSPLMISHHASYKGDRLSYHGIYFAVEKIGELAGIEDLHPHQFRHTYATDLSLLCQTGKTQSLKAFRSFTFQFLATNFSFY